MAVAEKKFTKKAETEAPRTLRYQLVETQERAKGRDKDTGEMVENPYPPIFIAPSSGVARDPKTGMHRSWRYIFGYNTIWVDEQIPEPTTNQLYNAKNDLIFTKGFLTVQSNDKAKVMAMEIQDGFEGNEDPLEDTPKIFRLLDGVKDREKVRNSADEAFEAESAARSAELDEMLPVAVFFGISVDDGDESRIRTEFILKARSNPSAFLRQFVNPKNKIQFVMTKALQKNLISTSIVPNNVVLVETGKALFDVKADQDVAEQIATLVMQNHEVATKLFNQLQKLV